jgi:hypothetical protein
MLVPREHLALFWNNNAGLIAVPSDQYFDHICHTPVLHIRSLAHGFLDAGIDSEVERRYFGAGHERIVLRK